MANASTHPVPRQRYDSFPDSRVLLDVDDIAALSHTTVRMARRLIAERRLPVVKIGRNVRVWSTDLAAYLEANTRPAVGAA